MSPPSAFAAQISAARKAYPKLADRELAFAAELERACGADPAALAALRVDELYLARAAAAQDPEALAVIDAQYLSRIRPAIAHLGDDSFAEEVAQRLRVSLLAARPDRPAKIGDYAGRGELLRWVRAVAVRTALNLLAESRNRHEAPEPELSELPFVGDDPQLEGMRRQYGERFREAMREAVASLPASTRVELRQYYFEGLGVEELGALYRVAPSTISRRLAKARELLFERARTSLRERLGISESEVDSVLRLIQGQLDVSRSAFDSQA